MNMSNINNFIKVKNDILSNGCIHSVSKDISLALWAKRILSNGCIWSVLPIYCSQVYFVIIHERRVKYISWTDILVWREAYVFYSSGLYLKNYYNFAKDNVFNTWSITPISKQSSSISKSAVCKGDKIFFSSFLHPKW